jgi:transposase InsO family protein
VKYALIESYQEDYPIILMCRVLGVSRPGYYAWLDREPSNQARRRASVGERLEALFYQFRRRYGSRRLMEELNDEGIACSENYVAYLMSERGLKALNGKGFQYERRVESMTQVKENVLGRNFSSEAPDRKWVADITYIKVGRRWAYLAVVLDLYSRQIVGWSLDTHMRESLVLQALEMALNRRDTSDGLLMHSDRGVQYRGNEYQQRLRDLCFVPSMSRKGNCWDNAVMESFFARLKVELIYPENYRVLDELRRGLFEYIEIFYNRQRRHSSLGYSTPANYELQFYQSNVSTMRG